MSLTSAVATALRSSGLHPSNFGSARRIAFVLSLMYMTCFLFDLLVLLLILLPLLFLLLVFPFLFLFLSLPPCLSWFS